MTPIERNNANLRAALSFYGLPEERGGVALISSPVTYSVFNIALLAEPVGPAPKALEGRIELARDHFRAEGRDWSFWVCEDWLPQRAQRRMHDIFGTFGMNCIAESPGMEIAGLSASPRPLPEATFRRVGDEATRESFTQLIAQCFYVPVKVAQQVYNRAGIWDAPLQAWLGYSEGEAVCAAATTVAAGALGIYSVATSPAHRRRGFAEAVMRHAVSEARPACPGAPIVLQSSSFGLRLYRQMGFKRTTRFFVFATY